MRILSVIEVLGPGGAEQAMVDLIVGLPEFEHVVWHFSRTNGKPLLRRQAERLRAHGVSVRDVHWRTVADPARRARELRGFEPDVVVFHWWRNEPWAPWLAEPRASGRPLMICALHSSRLTVSRGYDRYVAVAEFQAERLAHLDASRVVVIPNAVDVRRYRRPSRAETSRDGQPLVVGSLAGLRPGKIAPTFVGDAIGWRVPDAEWRIAGDGALRAAFQDDAANSELAGRMSFLGHLAWRAVPGFLSQLDVLCHYGAETLECNPIAVIEALSAGVPVVAERRGGMPALIEHGSNGLLASTVDEIGEHLRALAADRQLVRRLAEGARETAVRFDRQGQLEAYRRVLATQPHAGAGQSTAASAA